MKKLSFLILIVSLSGCATNNEGDVIIDQTLAVSGTDKLQHCDVEFVFRNKRYEAKFNDGLFEYVRQFEEDSIRYRDVLANEGFHREINGEHVYIPDSMAVKYANSVNSVIYFALLPRGLNDKAVNTAYSGTVTIAGESYNKVKITFDQHGGGEDYQDEYFYWVNREDHKIDYLAYSFHTEGGGMRFRKAYNERYVDGIRFVDYINYKPKHKVLLKGIDAAYIKGDLMEISRIVLEDIKVNCN